MLKPCWKVLFAQLWDAGGPLGSQTSHTCLLCLGPEKKHFPLSPLPHYLQSQYLSACSTLDGEESRDLCFEIPIVSQWESRAGGFSRSPCCPALPLASSVGWERCSKQLRSAMQLEKGRGEKLEDIPQQLQTLQASEIGEVITEDVLSRASALTAGTCCPSATGATSSVSA